jgi:hypothetical protein
MHSPKNSFRIIHTLLLIFFFFSFDIRAQQSVYATISGGDLYTIDLINCNRQFVGSTGYGFGDIAFTPNGKLWGIINSNLYEIDTLTANSILVGNTGIGAVSLVALNDTVLLAEFGMKLYGINTNTASSYYIDTIGYSAAGDLTWFNSDLYMTDPTFLVKMVLNSSNTAFVSVTPVNLMINPIPTCEGVVTATTAGNTVFIVGFSSGDAYKICPNDGSYQMLCSGINPVGTPGAAAIRLPSQQTPPCSLTDIDSANSVSESFSVFPNPANKSDLLNLNLSSENNELVTVVISSLQGQDLFRLSERVEDGGIQIDLNSLGLSSGSFLVCIYYGSERTYRIITIL